MEPPPFEQAHIWHDRHQVYLGGFQLEEHAAKPLLIELLRAFSRNNGKFLAETARNQQKTSQEAALKATAPVMSPDC
ncbi:hypothetical protein HaLaN_02679 [Haematococcus lacustris]|uniref:Uncharacterized protein n=1 Tax=Haematococcus lacustris TaxID=44745 RepID=A0A699YNW7_HAELA|nr:hypothetical protein HaLaN_02679 [Haematococcus lacustris]